MAQSIPNPSNNQDADSIRVKGFNRAKIVDAVFKNATLVFALTTLLIIIGVTIALYNSSKLTILDGGKYFNYFGTLWDPVPPDEGKLKGDIFGALPFVYGTLVTSFFAMLIAVPLGIGSAIFLAELAPNLTGKSLVRSTGVFLGLLVGATLIPSGNYAAAFLTAGVTIATLLTLTNVFLLPKIMKAGWWSPFDHFAQRLFSWVTTVLSFLVELLAAIPSIVYGFWALQYLVPLFYEKVEPWIAQSFGKIPFLAQPPEGFTGQDGLTASVVLAFMCLPFITAISRDVLKTVPSAQREASFGMGATQWETISGAVMRFGSGGIIGASMLGLGRALGETMAVTILIGSSPNLPEANVEGSWSLMRAMATMSSVIADQFPNPNTQIHASALTQIALTLFFVTVLVNALARGLVWLTAAKTTSSGTSERVNFLRNLLQKGLMLVIVFTVVGLLLYQIVQEFIAKGAGGLTSVSTLMGIVLLAVFLFNKWVPGKPFYLTWRKITSAFFITLCNICLLIAATVLIVLLVFVTKDGLPALTPQFFKLPDTINPDAGGMLHAIIGTTMLLVFASCIGVPFGIMGGIYLAEFGNNRIGNAARFAADLLNGVPAIVMGVFAYLVVVKPTVETRMPPPFDYFLNLGSFGTAGAFALGLMMIPTIMRTTEELIRLVPMSLREGSLGLGATRFWTTWKIVLPTVRSGIITGALLAVARVSGEAAPLIMVLCNSSAFTLKLSERISSLPMQIFVLRDIPGQLSLQQSWGLSLLLMAIVLIFSALARFFSRTKLKTRN